jgi:hypothetical protein
MGSELTAAPRFKVSEEYAKEGDLEKRVGTSREQVSLGSLPGLSYLAGLASKAGVSPESAIGRALNAPLPLTMEKDIPTGKKAYKLGYSPQYQQQGGPVNQYQQGGQIQPRRQQEIRNPHAYGSASGSPAFLPDSIPDTTGVDFQQMLDQTLANPEVYGPPVPAGIDSVLKQIMMRDVNQSTNPFSGDSLDFEGDSLRLLERMKKSHMPTYGRKKMQQGGVAGREAYGPPEPTGRQNIEAMQASGVLGQGQPLERRSLMGDANQDSRIAPMPMIEPDQYKMQLIPNAPQDTTMIEIPKLSSAYLPSLGVETPLSKRQNSLLQERKIAPQMLNSQVSGLIDRALVQRLANEPL